MLRDVGFDSVGALIDATVPKDIRLGRQLNLPEANRKAKHWLSYGRLHRRTKSRGHSSGLATTTASRRLSFSETFSKTLAGTTAYTPYQAGNRARATRALLNFQQMIID